MTEEMKRSRLRIILSLVLFLIAMLFSIPTIGKNILFFVAYLIVGYDVILKAFSNVFKGEVFDENFLMSIATIGAFLIGEYPEAVVVMFLYQVGELFQDYAVDESRKSVASLMDIRPDYAHVYRKGEFLKVGPNQVAVGDIILIKPGEKIPLDGIVVEGSSMLNTLALTGEAVPRRVAKNDEVLSGCINNEGVLKVKVTKKFGESTVSKILDLVENASSRKSKSENFIRKFAHYYTPIVVLIAVVLALVPPLVFQADFHTWIYRALSFLVVSCPCALVISVPLSFFAGIGASSKIGVLVKGSNYLEALAHTEIIVCDKTGTLTEGVFKVQNVKAVGIRKEELLKYTAYAECFSLHPIALSIKEAYGKKIDEKKVLKTKEWKGKGVRAVVDSKEVLVGNQKLMEEYHIKYQKSKDIGTVLYVAIDQKFVGTITIADKIKKDSYRAMKDWKENKVNKIVMLTGDREEISQEVAKELKLDSYYAELLPQDKVEKVDQLMTEKTPNGKLLFLGDGINDAPVLALSDIGVAMGGLGSDAAIEAADIVIMTDEPSKIASAIQIAKKTMKIVKENIIFAITVKIVVLFLCAFGLASMWAAVFADVGVSVLAVINALRILKVKS